MECEKAYGFLPCANDLAGSIFLMLVYAYFLLQGANLLSNGSEMLLEILNPGIVGGLLLPVLGALPDALIIIISGLGGGDDMAKLQEEVSVGMGTLAGSTVMLLTIAWGGSVILGSCDFDDNGAAIKGTLTKTCNWKDTGVTTDKSTPFNAVIMIATSVLYLVVQIPAWFGNEHPHLPAMLGCGACFLTLAIYCGYQVVVPELQKRKIAIIQKARMRQNAIHHFSTFSQGLFGSLVDENGNMRRHVVDQLFDHFDNDNSGSIESAELQALMTGLELGVSSDPNSLDEHIALVMTEFDRDNSGCICKEEFFAGMQKWINERVAHVKKGQAAGEQSTGEGNMQTALLIDSAGASGAANAVDEDDDEDSEEEPRTHMQIAVNAIALLVAGTLICAVFSDPMVGAVTGFATATKIPAFFVAFVVTPLASNASELVSSLKFAMSKRRKTISLTFCQVYGAVTMNNCLCLGLFLSIVYSRGLEWSYGPEVLSTVIPTAIVGVLGSRSVSFSSWVAIPVLLLYPAALLLVFVLKHLQ